MKKIKLLLTQCCRAFQIIIHRYLIFSFVAFIIASKLVFAETEQDLFVLLCAVAVLGFVIVFFGRRGAMYSYFIGLGFLASVTCSVLGWVAFFIEIPLFLAVSMYLVADERNNNRKIKEKIMSNFMTVDDLYTERRDSFEAILKYISNHSVIGIDSPYGNGKSSVVEALRRKRRNWEFITIGILSTTLENVEFCIIREINRVLESYGVFSNPISKVKSFFSHDFAYCVGDFLFESQSYEEQMRNYVDDIHDLGKVIVLNFEDIDRITNIEHLNKIFAICDTLLKIEAKREPKKRFIKVIYQYSAKTLDKLFMENYGDERYTEKYIPHSVSLPVLTGEFFEYVLKKNENKYAMVKKYKGEKDNIFNFLSQQFEFRSISERYSLKLDDHTVRGVEFVLDKVNAALEFCKKDIDNSENNKNILNITMTEYDASDDQKKEIVESFYFETILIFNITRYFFPNIYKVLKKKVGIESQCVFFRYDSDGTEHSISLMDLRARVWKAVTEEKRAGVLASTSPENKLYPFFKDIFNKKVKDNRDALIILCLLSFDKHSSINECERLLGCSGDGDDELIQRIKERNKIFLKLMDLH